MVVVGAVGRARKGWGWVNDSESAGVSTAGDGDGTSRSFTLLTVASSAIFIANSVENWLPMGGFIQDGGAAPALLIEGAMTCDGASVTTGVSRASMKASPRSSSTCRVAPQLMHSAVPGSL